MGREGGVGGAERITKKIHDDKKKSGEVNILAYRGPGHESSRNALYIFISNREEKAHATKAKA